MGKQILVVDDDPVTLEALAETLRIKLQDVDVAVCVSAQRAFEAVGFFNYDLVITDVRMPEMDGTELLKRIKTIRPDLPVLLMSGHPDEMVNGRPGKTLANAFLAKPLNPKALTNAIRQVFTTH
jgi:DNA-binding NtrC family response regulator